MTYNRAYVIQSQKDGSAKVQAYVDVAKAYNDFHAIRDSKLPDGAESVELVLRDKGVVLRLDEGNFVHLKAAPVTKEKGKGK